MAITGGTGFVGQHVVAAALARGHRVQALTRRPQAPAANVQWVAGDLGNKAALTRLVTGADVVIHIAGATNARNRAAFAAANVTGTQNLLAVMANRPLVHVSSLAAREPQLSLYGWSKREGENLAMARQPSVAVRPPAVYGPGDTEFLTLLRTARHGWVPFPRHARMAMIYAPDLAAALLALAEDLCADARSAGGIFEISDGRQSYGPEEIAAAMAEALGRRVRNVAIAPAMLRLLALADTAAARLAGRTPRLSIDRARYMTHPDWSADCSDLLALGLWQPATALLPGLQQTVAAARLAGCFPA